MSTPRTDGKHGCYFAGEKMVPANFARDLERENAAQALRWELKIAEIGAEVWRTQQASKRAERKGYGS